MRGVLSSKRPWFRVGNIGLSGGERHRVTQQPKYRGNSISLHLPADTAVLSKPYSLDAQKLMTDLSIYFFVPSSSSQTAQTNLNLRLGVPYFNTELPPTQQSISQGPQLGGHPQECHLISIKFWLVLPFTHIVSYCFLLSITRSSMASRRRQLSAKSEASLSSHSSK